MGVCQDVSLAASEVVLLEVPVEVSPHLPQSVVCAHVRLQAQPSLSPLPLKETICDGRPSTISVTLLSPPWLHRALLRQVSSVWVPRGRAGSKRGRPC